MTTASFSFRRACRAVALAVALLLFCADAALAHRVNIFAWLEGNSVAVECSFRRNAPVKGGIITVFDDTGAEVLRGTTDADGRFSFPVPQVVRKGHGLRIRINAGEGHQNEWRMDAAEFAGLAPAAVTAPTAAAAPAPVRTDAQPELRVSLTREELTAIIDGALERQLAPLRRELAALSEEGPRLQDVVGGLGWIMGLVGMGLYFARRRP